MNMQATKIGEIETGGTWRRKLEDIEQMDIITYDISLEYSVFWPSQCRSYQPKWYHKSKVCKHKKKQKN